MIDRGKTGGECRLDNDKHEMDGDWSREGGRDRGIGII